MNSLSKNIKSQRLSNNMTQEELAEKLSVTRQTVSCWENGKSEPDLEMIIKLSELFGIDVNSFICSENSSSQKRSSHKKNCIIISVVFILLFSFVLFGQKSETATAAANFYNAAANQQKYRFEISKIENLHFQLFCTDGKISVSQKDLDSSEYIFITDYSFNGEKIIIKGKTEPIYQNETSGKIAIPSVYTETYFSSPENFIDFLYFCDESAIREAFGENTGSGIFIAGNSPFEANIVYYAVPLSYKILKNGSIEFEFVFEKTKNVYSNKPLSEYISEGTPAILYFKCITLEWEYNEPIGAVADRIQS